MVLIYYSPAVLADEKNSSKKKKEDKIRQLYPKIRPMYKFSVYAV